MRQEAIVVPGVRERAVRFASGGETLAGILSLPETGCVSARGAVALHGWGTYRAGPHDILVKLSRELARRGVPVLRFDFRGRGESSGAFFETDLDAMLDDASRASEVLRELVRVEAVGAAGLCSGANVALGAAAHFGSFDRVAALSALPFQSHKSAMQEFRRTGGMLARTFRKALRPATWAKLLMGRVRVLRVLRTLFGGEGGRVRTPGGATRNLKDSSRDLMGELARYRGRVLFVWGGSDPEGMGAKAHFEDFARASSLDAEFRVIEGSGHNFHSLRWEAEAVSLVADFLGAS